MKEKELKYTTTKIFGNTKIQANIRLSDDCKNGHNDFAITGTVWEGYGKERWEQRASGCVHDEIVKFFPEFKMFVDLHLFDVSGDAMYAIENGLYFFREKSKQDTMRYLRLQSSEYEKLLGFTEDGYIFALKLIELGVVKRWEEEAGDAIKKLETLTGREFGYEWSKGHSSKFFTEEALKECAQKISDGYYTHEAISQRKEKARQDKLKAAIDKINSEFEKRVKKATNERDVCLYLVTHNISLDNFIYYNHTNEGHFNWRSGCDRMSQEDFNAFVESIDYSNLPSGIKFILK